MKNILLSFCLLLSFSSILFAQTNKNNFNGISANLKKYDKDAGSNKSNLGGINLISGTCISNAGTISSTLDGLPTTNPIYVCYNSCYALASNNDYILPIPVAGETSEWS